MGGGAFGSWGLCYCRRTRGLTPGVPPKACFSTEGSLAQAGRQLEALKELCDTLSPEDAHRLAKAQLQECERRLAAIQRQFSGDRDTPPPDAGYCHSRSAFMAQLAKNNENLKSFPSGAVSSTVLHTQLQDLQALEEETEMLLYKFALQCSQRSQFKGEERSVEQDKTELMQQWQDQQHHLQGRVKSLRTAVGIIDPVEKQISHISEHLEHFIKKPKDVTAFSLTDTNCLQDIKNLDEDIQREMDRLSGLDREEGLMLRELDPEDRGPVSHMVLGCRHSLDLLRQQVKKSEAATRALDRFLMSLRTVEQDISGTRAAPCEDAGAVRDCRSRLALIRPSLLSMRDKAPQLDLLLEGAGLSVSQGGVPASCLDMVSVLVRRLEGADAGLARQQQSLQREQEARSLGLRQRTLLGALRDIQGTAERQGLKEPTLPAVQHRLRALADVESRLAALRAELQSLQDAGQEGDVAAELQRQWEDTQRAVTEGQERSRALMELLKKFQSCRSRLSNTLQRAEQTVSEQASYMGKDNLQRLIATVRGIKEDLGGLGEGVEEIRGVCRQLQSLLKKIPECADAPFESEADALVDRWLDVSEKTDSHMDNLRVGLEMWDKLQMLGGEVDSWMGSKMSIFAERHPFQCEEEVIALQDEIQTQEENIERFHRKSAEIQQLLQSKESPLELQVMETQLRKKMEQVKELFSDSSDVFQELMAVRQHITERMNECQSSLQSIQSSLSTLSASENPQLPTQIQELFARLQSEAEQADCLLREVSLMASVASPRALQALTAQGVRLKENIRSTKEMIDQRKEQAERGFLRVIKDECQAFEDWFQDLQLSVNECFENPEKRQDVEASVQKLTGFLEYREGERRLGRLKERVARAGEQLSSEQLAPLSVWLQEQEEELTTFRSHCQDRHSHLEACLRTFNSLQDEYSHLNAWLQAREHKSVQGEELNRLHEEVLNERERVEGLSVLVAAVRKQGLRGDSLVRESSDLLERYRSLQDRLSRQAEAQTALAEEARAFEAQAESVRAWVKDLQQRVHSLGRATKGGHAEVEDRLQQVKALLNARCEGDFKLQELRRSGQSLSQQRGLEESRRSEVLQAVKDAEEQWNAVMKAAEDLCSQAVAQSALAREEQVFEAQAGSTRAWIRDLQQQVDSLDKGTEGSHAELEERLHRVKALLNARCEGDSKLQELRRSGQSLSQQRGLEESRRSEVLQAVKDAEEQWNAVMKAAEDLCSQAVAQSALAREEQVFEAQAGSTRAWIRDLQQQVDSLDKGTEGSQTELEDRLQKFQALLNARCEGDSKLQELRRSGQSLSQQRGLEESRRSEVLQAVKDAEEQWNAVMKAAEELCRNLQGVVERLMSCLYQKQQAQARVEQLQRQTAELPRQFPWPGLGDRRQAMEHARSLLDRSRALTPALSALRAQGMELSQLTHDASWTDPSWAALEACSPCLLKDLTECCQSLEDGIQTERLCAQLLEQHSAAQDWLQEQVRGIGPLPSDRHGLQSTINTLKALLQTADREEREMRELESVKDSLLGQCTPSGQAALAEEVSHLHERRSSSEKEVRDRLRDYEARLQELDAELDRRAQRLREEAGGLQGELCKLSQGLGYGQQHANMSQLQEHWHALKSCERQLEELGVKVQSLQQAAESEETLPGDVIAIVATAAQEHSRLRSQLSERLDGCTESTARCLRESLQTVQQWNESVRTQGFTDSSHAIQEGEQLRRVLQEALSHRQFLKDSVGLGEVDRLERDSSDALRESATHTAALTQSLQNVAEKRKQEVRGHASAGTIPAAEQQIQMSQVETQVQKHTPKICPPSEEMDRSSVQAGINLHEAEKNLPMQQPPSSWSAETKIVDRVPYVTKMTEMPGMETLQKETPLLEQIHIETGPGQQVSDKTIQTQTSQTEPTEPLRDGTVESRLYRSSYPTEVVQRRYIVLDVPEEPEAERVLSEKPGVLHVETQDYVVQPSGQQTERSEPMQQEEQQKARMMYTHTAYLEEEHPATPETLGQPSETPRKRIPEPRESVITEDTVHLNAERGDRVPEQTEAQQAQVEHAEKPKALHPDTREAVAQERTDGRGQEDSERRAPIDSAQAGSELRTSGTAAEIMQYREISNLESIKPQQEQEEDAVSKPQVLRETAHTAAEEVMPESRDTAESEDLPQDLPHGPTMQEIFTEIQQLVEVGPNTLLIEEEPLREIAGNLDTSLRDLEIQLSHTVLRILGCRNRPAQLNTIAMTKQVEEVEDCRQCAQERVAAFSRMGEVEGRDSETQHMGGQWSATLWDSSAAVHAKEAQLQLVIQYHKQTLAAKATLEKLTAELEAVRTVPGESSSLEAEKLRAVLRDLEQERTVIGELLQTHTKLCPHLSQADRAVAQTQLEQIQGEWRALERAAEKMLHHVSVHIQETSGLLLEAQELGSQIETLRESLGPARPSPLQWDSQRAGQLVVIGSALTAANQHYLHLKHSYEAISKSPHGEKEKKDIVQALQCVKEQLEHLQAQISMQTPSSSNETLGKIMKVMHDAFTWAKQTESDIEAKKKVGLLPEEVHSQIKGLKKLQSDISAKQSQLESLMEEVRELTPELDEKDIPMVMSSLDTLEDLAKSTAEKLSCALQLMESGLQSREKMSEQIADVDSWVVAHTQKETAREANGKGSTPDLERKLRQLQETLREADKQAAVTEALLMRSRDIAPELGIDENCYLNDKLMSLQENIRGIISYEKANCRELEELLQAQDASMKKLALVENSLRQMSVELKKFRFPITKDSLCALEPIKHMIMEQKFQVDQLRHCREDKRTELLSVIAELQKKVDVLALKAQEHEKYLCHRQRIEDLKENVEKQILRMKDDSIGKEEQYKSCQALLTQFPLIRSHCQAAAEELQNISSDLYPSELSCERQRLKQITDSFSTWELTVHNDVKILEWVLQKSLHYPTEHKAMVDFLKQASSQLEQPIPVELTEQALDRELLKCVTIQKSVESRARVLEALEHRSGAREKGQRKHSDLADLTKRTINGCEGRMDCLSQVRRMLRSYSTAVRGAVRLLQEAESRLLLPLGRIGSCSEELQHTQQSLAALDVDFQSHINQVQTLVPQHACLSSQQVEQLHIKVLSQLLVRVSTLQAQARLRMEALQRCTKNQKSYMKSHKKICQHLKTIESTLAECISHNATSYKAYLEQQEKLKALVQDVDSLTGKLGELQEWCPERRCSGNREEAVSALWRQWSKLQRCAHYLKARSDQRGAEWTDITKSLERAAIVLDQLQDELPDTSRVKIPLEELQELLVCTEQYQDRLDCEHRALTALELRVARLLGVPAHQEQTPPIQLCQELQTMQSRYRNLKEKSMLGRQAAHLEVQEREQVKEEIRGVKEWLMAAISLLTVMDDLPSTQDLQEVQTQLGSQKAALQGIMDNLRMKYSDMYSLVPVEIEGPLQEVTRSLQEVEEKVGEAMEKSGPLCRLGGRVEEIRVGLQSVLALLEQKSLTVAEAESRQKRVWDELDRWHSCMAALEVEVHDLAEEHPEEAQILTDKLMEPLQLYQHVAKQAEQRTTFLSKIHTCLQEHEEMIKSSKSWLSEAHDWLTAPCIYVSSKCLASHVSALQMVLDDSEQMRRTLQGFAKVLQEISSVCDMAAQEEQLAQADQHVATMQQSIVGQLSQYQHAAAEVEAIETEVEKMEQNLNKIRAVLSSQDSTTSPEDRHKNLQMVLGEIESMKRTIAEIQICKPGLCLPEGAEETLTVFQRVQHLLQQIQALEGVIKEKNPTLKLTIGQAVELSELSTSVSEEVIVPSPTLSIPGDSQGSDGEDGHIRIVHVEEDVLRRSGASLMTVEESSPEQRLSWVLERTHQETWDLSLSEGEEDSGSSCSSSSETLTGSVPEDPDDTFTGEKQATAASEGMEHIQEGDKVLQPLQRPAAKDVVGLSLPPGADMAEAISKPVATVRTQALSQSMELLGQSGLAWQGEDSQPERLKTQSRDTQGTRKPAGDTPTTRTVPDDTHTLPKVSADTVAPHTPALSRATGETGDTHCRPSPTETAHGLPRYTERASEDTVVPVLEERVIDLQDTLNTHTALAGSSRTEGQPSEGDSGNTSADQTRHTPTLSAEIPSQEDADGEPAAAPLASGETCPAQEVLHACRKQAAQLEVWLERAQKSLGVPAPTAAMQESVEQQLLNCQEMFLEIEQKVASLSALGQQTGSPGAHQEAEALSSKLEVLKSSLVTFQQLLQERQNEEQEVLRHAEPPLEGRLKRSASVQEMLTSTKSKLIRQNSMQQQRELGHELSEQRDLTKAIARHSSRTRLHSLSQDTHTQAAAGTPTAAPIVPAEAEEGAMPQEKWAHLDTRLAAKLQALEESTLQAGSQVTGTAEDWGSSVMVRDAGAHTLQEVQSQAAHLRELGHIAGNTLAQQVRSGEEDPRLRLDEELYQVLCAVDLSLCSVTDMLLAPCGTSSEDTQLQLLQLESLSTELTTLGSDLNSHGSEVSHALSSVAPRASSCLDHLQGRLSIVQTLLSSRQAQLRTRLDLTNHCQRDIRGLHESLLDKKLLLNQTINEAAGHDLDKQFQSAAQLHSELLLQESQVSALRERVDGQNLPTALMEEVTKLEDVLDSTWSSLRERREELRERLGLEQRFEELLQGLAGLVEIGRERLARTRGLRARTRAELQDHLSRHKSYFQHLGAHLAALQHFSSRVPDTVLQKQEVLWPGLEQEVHTLQQQALEQGTQLQRTLEAWTRWEQNCSRLRALLQGVESRLPSVGLVEETEERLRERLSIYQQMKGVLEESGAQLSLALEQGKGLQAGGPRGEVAVAVCELEARWLAVQRRVEQEGLRMDRLRKTWSRFRRDSVALAEWMGSARERLQTWKRHSVTVPQQLDHVRIHLAQFLEFTKEVETRSVLKASVVSSGTQLLQLKDTDTASLQAQLTQLEQCWAEVLSVLPTVQDRLHQLLMERLPSREVIAELNTWISEMEARLEEQHDRVQDHKTSTAASLTQVLQLHKELKLEMACHQLSVDFVNQSVLQTSSPDIQTKRYERTNFAEELGVLNERWLHLQGALSSQTRYVEQLLHACADRENKLQLLRCWVVGQRERMRQIERPVSRSSAEKALKECEETEEKLKVKSAELQVLREVHLTPGEGRKQQGRDDEFISQTDAVHKACTTLSQQVSVLRWGLRRALEVWDQFEKGLDEAALIAGKACYSLEQGRTPQISLRSLQDRTDQLQLLQDQLERDEMVWDALSGTLSTLRDMVSPAAGLLLTERLEGERARWRSVNQELEEDLRKSQRLLQLWQGYSALLSAASLRLKRHQEEAGKVLRIPAQESTAELLQTQMKAVNGLKEGMKDLQNSMEEMLEGSKDLTGQMEPEAAVFIQSQSCLLSRSVAQLGGALDCKLEQLQEELEQLQELNSSLESLETHLKDSEGRLTRPLDPGHMDVTKAGLLALSAMSPDLDVLNELSHRVAISDPVARRLQTLNRQWALASSRAVERCSELQAEALRQQSFEQKCQSWMDFLQSMEDNLAVDIAGCYPGLREQLRVHQRYQVEVSVGHQILHSVINEALLLLERGEVEDRSDFILKLSQLREQWHGVVRRAQQRRALVEGLVRHWQLYTRSVRKLSGLLREARALLPPHGPVPCSLTQLHSSLEDLKHMELLFRRHQSCYIQTLEVGRQLFSMGDAQTQAQLQTELGALQEDWELSQGLLGKRRALTLNILQTWEYCEARLIDSRRRLEEMKTKLKQLLPEQQEELQTAEELTKEAEDSLEDWAQSLTELATMKTDLSQYIIADDVVLLQEQVEHLHCQWEELCLKVSLRKQEIADRLNAWIIFNEKNKELCEWLTQMENKVAHNADLSIEEMVEKLKKDCMEEINLFSENKTHLKQLGEQLITASNKTKETEINDKLKDINDRWQHLFDHIEARVRKLKETLVTVQQLDKNMSNLRTWLSRIEAELAKPVVYSVCHNDEIQRKLAEQQDLQRDIEQHTEGVASVLTLCDVLLHDADACGSDMENDSIQQTSRSLDRRWRNICAMSMERRMRIEETWRLWCKFLDDYSRFEDWLKMAERTAANPNSADVLYTIAKEELKKFEAFQRQVHERLTQLELVNKQYRRLARENRTDAASKIKVMVHEGNQGWDNLQKRVAAILRRLKHFTSQREEFEGTREGILVWLTEMDLQLTNVEHFSESDIDDKMRQLNGFQQEITLNTNKIDQLIVFGENLIQKCAPLDAVLIEDELEELHSYCQEVFGRVARFHHRLTSRRPMLEEERDLSDRDTDLEDSVELSGGSWQEEKEGTPGDSPSRRAVCHLLAPPLERSGRETPVSVDSIPLEWDHTVDVGGSSSHEDEEEGTFYSALSDVEITESPESFVKATAKALRAASGKSVTEPPSWHSPEPQDRKLLHRDIIRGLGSSPAHTSTPYQQGYAKLMSECSGSIDNVKRVKLILNDDDLPEEQGLTGLANAEKQSGVIERWELLQAKALSDELRIKHNLQQWQQLNSDLSEITSWLAKVLPELDRLQRIKHSTSIQTMESNIKELKAMKKAFDNYKAVMISVNLSGRDFQQADSAEAQELQESLRNMNQGWMKACAALESWEAHLQNTLMQCQEFHETLHSLLLWLAHTESRRFAVNIHDPSVERSVLREHKATLMGLEEELLERQRQVSSLQEISSQLLLEAVSEDSTEAKEKVHVISNKLRLLLRQVAHDLRTVQGRLDSCSPSRATAEGDYSGLGAVGSQLSPSKEVTGDRTAGARPPGGRRAEKRDASPPRSFFYRVLRAAVPLHLLFLLLLVLACLVPLSEEDYSCALSNNFARSFYPMLHYTNGPPPT
ncbi:hypothetical protein MATL_G00163020 [Megalops atlanticus]|uniref:KASH domain-containing protein n=1 Tax=Megalops atlanticus TaxID=7932 RepID=A0A9D3T987_MEGAT|nr:hypothetical protein MATL_G00163020 [Megalops atlanticus]